MDRDFTAGRLIQPAAHRVENFGEWGIACRADRIDQQHIKTFTQWLVQDVHDHT